MKRLMAVYVALAGLTGYAADGTKGESGPLTELPSAPGPHIAKIEAMSNRQWLKLGTPKADPKYGLAPGRSYTPKMAFADDLRGAFLYGEGWHGMAQERGGALHYNDDLFFYDINANRWICVHPGTNVAAFKMKLDQNGWEVTEDGEPVPIAWMGHGGQQTAYISSTRRFTFVPWNSPYWETHLGKKRMTWTTTEQLAEARKHPWFYHVDTNKWEKLRVESSPNPNHTACLTYLPKLNRLVLYDPGQEAIHLYDVASNTWIRKVPEGKAPDGKMEGLTCYDSSRERLYIFNRALPSIPWIYDIPSNKWWDAEAQGQPGDAKVRAIGTVQATIHYDAAADCVIARMGMLSGKTAEHPGLYVYDCKANLWEEKPVPFPEGMNGCWNGFYDPKLNVHFYHLAGDSRTNGVIWLYRHANR